MRLPWVCVVASSHQWMCNRPAIRTNPFKPHSRRIYLLKKTCLYVSIYSGMNLKLESGFSFSSWRGEFFSEAGEKIAAVEYAEHTSKAVLTISCPGSIFEMISTTESFHGSSSGWGGGGKMLHNGKPVYTFTAKTPAEIEVKTARPRAARSVLKSGIDSWNRRFRWAYRQGEPWYKAWQYASWGHILMGDKYCFCSMYHIGAGRRLFRMDQHPVFNAADEQVWATLKDTEKLLVLALSARHLCGVYVGKTQTPLSSIFSSSCPNVPSFIINEKGRCDINPRRFRCRILGEFLFTGNSVTWFIVAAMWVLYHCSPNSGTLGVAVMFSIIGFFWILISRWADKFEPLEW